MTADEIRKQTGELSRTLSDMCQHGNEATPQAIEIGSTVSLSAAAWEIAAQLAELNAMLMRVIDTKNWSEPRICVDVLGSVGTSSE